MQDEARQPEQQRINIDRENVPSVHSKEELYEAAGQLQSWFVRELWTTDPKSESVKATTGLRYLTDLAKRRGVTPRGFPKSLVVHEGFGYVPPFPGQIRRAGEELGYPCSLLYDLGLLHASTLGVAQEFEKRNGRKPASSRELTAFFIEHMRGLPEGYYDYARFTREDGKTVTGDCVTIPLRDEQRRVIGWILRSTDPKLGSGLRYKAPPGTLICPKEISPGFAEARDAIETSGACIIVEGPLDRAPVRWSVRDLPGEERPGVFSLGGVALRKESSEVGAEVFKTLPGKRVYLWLDADVAGMMNAIALSHDFLRLGCDVRIIRAPDGVAADDPSPPKDAGELFLREGEAGIRTALRAGATRTPHLFAAEVWPKIAGDRTLTTLWERANEMDRFIFLVAYQSDDEARNKAAAWVSERSGIDLDLVLMRANEIRSKGENWRDHKNQVVPRRPA